MRGIPYELNSEAAERARSRGGLPTDFNAFLRIGEDGRVTCFTGKIEMGQGIITSLAQMLADELNVKEVHFLQRSEELVSLRATPFERAPALMRAIAFSGSVRWWASLVSDVSNNRPLVA